MSTAQRGLVQLAATRGDVPYALASVCSAHPLVLLAALRRGARLGVPVLIEATCNQVNHAGGYTGMRPGDFVARVRAIAREEGFDTARLILGGDHLGPNPWRGERADVAMDEAERMVRAYAAAGFGKIHLDASMRCADDPERLDEGEIAHRAARLALAAEESVAAEGLSAPVYVIGTEVPPPGGATHALDAVTPTDPAAALETLAAHRESFAAHALEAAFERVVALVVQPGVEYADADVHAYRPEAARALAAVLDAEPALCFEAHSTDYQTPAALERLARDGHRLQKVGPWLTFALREALYALDAVAAELDRGYPRGALPEAMERVMLAEPVHWRGHCGGESDDARRLARHYGYADRIRYYWSVPEAERAVARLFGCLSGRVIPETLLSQYLPESWREAMGREVDAETLVVGAIERVLDHYPRPP